LIYKHPTTPLASSQLNGHDRIAVELVEPDGRPAKVKITWPEHPSLIHPERFPDCASTIALLFARSHVVLASLKASGEL
jgi:hypothetical protein